MTDKKIESGKEEEIEEPHDPAPARPPEPDDEPVRSPESPPPAVPPGPKPPHVEPPDEPGPPHKTRALVRVR